MNQTSFQYRLADFIEKNKYLICFAAIGIVYFFNLFIDIMEVDAAQYASISREMSKSGSYLQVFEHGRDYLDKPPLLFWMASISIRIFGASNWAYKIPALLIIIIGIYSTFGFAKLWYGSQKAKIAALILCTTQAFFLITNDVRTDGILTGFVMLAVWQLSLFLKNNRLIHLLTGSLALGAAMLSKGPVGMVIVAFAIGGDLLLKRQFKQLFKVQWLILLLVVAVTLLPMCYGLYQQFDLHPEKEVYGLKGPSGLKFFFWTQSFGRITGASSWNNHSGIFYFFQTILWDFQPWILFLIPALFSKFRNLFKFRFKGPDTSEYMTLCGFVLTFAVLSMSSYKLPHYIFPLFPFIAIITADYIVAMAERPGKFMNFLSRFHIGFIHLFFIVPVLSFLFFFPVKTMFLPLVLALLFLLFCYAVWTTKNRVDFIILPTAIMAFTFGLVMSTYFYPSLLKYQAPSIAAKEVYGKKLPEGRFYSFHTGTSSLDFYSRSLVPEFDINRISAYDKGTCIYTDKAGMDEIQKKSGEYGLIETLDNFHVTGLAITFLNKKTRNKVIDNMYLLEKQY